MAKATEYSDTRYDRVRYLDEFRALISKRWEEGYALIDLRDRGVLVWRICKRFKG